MSADHKDKWLETIKDQVGDYREPLPDGFWNSVEKDIPAPVPVWWKRKGAAVSFLSAAAALVALFLILPQVRQAERQPDGVQTVAVVENPPAEHGADVLSARLLADLPAQTAGQLRKPAGREQERAADRPSGKLSGKERLKSAAGGDMPVDEAPETVVEKTEASGDENLSGSVALAENDRLSLAEKQNDTENAKADEGKSFADEVRKPMHEEDWGADPEAESRGKRMRHLAFHAGNSGMPRADHGAFDFNSDRASNALMGDMSFSNVTELKDNISRFDGQPAQIYNYRHNQPFKAGLSFAFDLGKGFSLETGLTYQFLKSFLESGNDEMTQKMHYLGIPLRANWSFVRTRYFSAYVGAGALFEKCLHADIAGTKVAVKGIQSSLNGMVGAQYNINRHAAIYFEPGICYYLGMKGDGVLAKDNGYVVKNVYSEEPLGLTLSAGFRFSF